MLSYRTSRSYLCLLCQQRYEGLGVRFYNKKLKQKKLTNIDTALSYFDSTYPALLGDKWPSVRLSLLTTQKYAAIINNASPAYKDIIHRFKELGTIEAGQMYRDNCSVLKIHKQDKKEQKVSNASETPDKIPFVQMTDNEKAQHECRPEPQRYPSYYKRIPGAGSPIVTTPSEDRIVLPQDHLSTEAQADLLNDFIPSGGLKGLDELEEESDIFLKHDVSSLSDAPVTNVELANEFLHWPEMLTVMVYYQGMVGRFPQPQTDYGASSHYALNGSSIMPVLLLDLRSGDRVLDACAAPGGKSFAILQTGLPGLLHSNDLSMSRVKHLEAMLSQFYSPDSDVMQKVAVTRGDGRVVYGGGGCFDKVLVDVPCLNDRHTLNEHDNNILSNMRKNERLALPETQADLLIAAVQNVRVGGTVVYSTCTLSPIQNDGVVHLALHRLWDKTNIKCKVIDYGNVVHPFKFMYKFGKDLGLKYGQLILPNLLNNYGPMYCSKIVRIQ